MSTEEPKEPVDKPEPNIALPPTTPPPRVFTTDEKRDMARYVHLDYRGTIHYQGTKVLQIAREPSTLSNMMDLHGVILTNLRNEFGNQGYLTKNKHRQLTQLINMYSKILSSVISLGFDVEVAIEQSRTLDMYTEQLFKEFRATQTNGNVEYVDDFHESIQKRIVARK